MQPRAGVGPIAIRGGRGDTEGFRRLARETNRLADALCGGRVVAFLEGGYSLDHLPLCNLAVVEELAGLVPSSERDPIEIDVPVRLGDDAKQAVDSARSAARL